MENVNNGMSNQVLPSINDEVSTKRREIVRFKPSLLSDVLSSLSVEQKKWINETGFGAILLFNLKEYPYDVSMLILNSYKPNISSIQIQDLSFGITEEAVHEVLGLPIGDQVIEFSRDRTVFNDWILSFGNEINGFHVLPSVLCKAIKHTNVVDEHFKINFIVLLSNVLIESSYNPYMNKKMVNFAGDLDRCFKFNWCKYLLQCLEEEFVFWSTREDSFFKGSLAFLLFFSLERFVMFKNIETRGCPPFVKWSDSMIHELKAHDLYPKKKGITFDNVCSTDEKHAKLKRDFSEFQNEPKAKLEHLIDANNIFESNDSVELMQEKSMQFLSKKYILHVRNIEMSDFVTNGENSKRFLNSVEMYSGQINRAIWNLLNSDGENPNEICFKWKEVYACKIDFQSMKAGEMILTSIIDVWCCYLSHLQTMISSNSIKRLFCFTHNTVGIVNSKEKMYDVFEENLNDLLKFYDVMIEDINLIFFPMLVANHHYVVCYNLKNPSLEILDNRKSEKELHQLYGDQIDILHDHFIKFLGRKFHDNVLELKIVTPERLEMSWQTKDNDVDCGVFSMLHMETYMGGGSSKWIAYIPNESYEQICILNDMRLNMVHAMLTSNMNELRDQVMTSDDGKDGDDE